MPTDPSHKAKYRFVITRIAEDGSELTEEYTLDYEGTMGVGPMFKGVLGRMDERATGIRYVSYGGGG